MDISTQVINVINEIALKLGVAAEKVYPILRQQAFIEGSFGLIKFIILLGVFIVSCLTLRKTLINPKLKVIKAVYSWETDKEVWEDSQETKVIICTGCIIISFIIMMLSINSIITALFNPDWYILNDLLRRLVK